MFCCVKSDALVDEYNAARGWHCRMRCPSRYSSSSYPQGLFFHDKAGGKLVPPTHPREIFTCLLVGLLGYGAQISLTYGLRSAKAAPAIATSYLSVVWGVLAGYFLFKEVCTGGL